MARWQAVAPSRAHTETAGRRAKVVATARRRRCWSTPGAVTEAAWLLCPTSSSAASRSRADTVHGLRSSDRPGVDDCVRGGGTVRSVALRRRRRSRQRVPRTVFSRDSYPREVITCRLTWRDRWPSIAIVPTEWSGRSQVGESTSDELLAAAEIRTPAFRRSARARGIVRAVAA